jgi:hypothetical protein
MKSNSSQRKVKFLQSSVCILFTQLFFIRVGQIVSTYLQNNCSSILPSGIPQGIYVLDGLGGFVCMVGRARVI